MQCVLFFSICRLDNTWYPRFPLILSTGVCVRSLSLCLTLYPFCLWHSVYCFGFCPKNSSYVKNLPLSALLLSGLSHTSIACGSGWLRLELLHVLNIAHYLLLDTIFRLKWLLRVQWMSDKVMLTSCTASATQSLLLRTSFPRNCTRRNTMQKRGNRATSTWRPCLMSPMPWKSTSNRAM